VSEDRELADAVVRAGDEVAFRALYRRHTPALYRLALRLGGGDGAWAEELVQRTWVRAVEGLRSFAWRSSLASWLGGIAINCAREVWRETRTRSETPLDVMRDEIPASAPRPLAPEERLDLDRAIERLPAGYREVFVLHDVEGYTHEEIGGLLGIETGTSKSQLSRARQRLREALAPESRRSERRNG
jgi:RNA polymerase sigma-70 factor (ECF subfamily)